MTTAVAVTAAMAVLGRPDIASAAEQLVSLHSCVDRRKVQLAVTGSNTKRSGAASPVLWAVHLSSARTTDDATRSAALSAGHRLPDAAGREYRAA